MRIIAGKLGGRLVKISSTATLRPTTQRVREAVFSALQSNRAFDELTVADLFAGSGSYGIESLSRGAKHCLFVERDRNLVTALHSNLGELGLERESHVLAGELPGVLSRIPNQPWGDRRFDLIFADPPYADSIAELPALLLDGGFIRESTMLILETSSKAVQTLCQMTRGEGLDLPGRGSLELRIVWQRDYGDSSVTMYRAYEITPDVAPL